MYLEHEVPAYDEYGVAVFLFFIRYLRPYSEVESYVKVFFNSLGMHFFE